MERILTDNMTRVSQSPVFNAETVPKSLLNYHDVKAGTSGVINVKEGQITYFIHGQDEPVASIKSGNTFVILPNEKHYIQVSDDAQFFIEFYRVSTASDDSTERGN